MNCGIATGKRKHAPNHSDKERQSLRREFPHVEELGKDLLGGPMIGHISQGNENREEAKNVEDQDKSLKSGKNIAANTVDGDRKCHDRPEYKSCVPAVGLIITVSEHD